MCRSPLRGYWAASLSATAHRQSFPVVSHRAVIGGISNTSRNSSLVVRAAGLEPATTRFRQRASIQLRLSTLPFEAPFGAEGLSRPSALLSLERRLSLWLQDAADSASGKIEEISTAIALTCSLTLSALSLVSEYHRRYISRSSLAKSSFCVTSSSTPL